MRNLIVIVCLASLWGTRAILPGNWHPYPNEKGPGKATQASFEVGDAERRDEMFVGIALSGGGSRAANFGAAVLLELRKLGVLDDVDFLSSVSGGTLPAAYFSLEGYEYFTLTGFRKITFSEDELRGRFMTNFQMRYVGRWFLPWNILRYWLTNFTRTEIMYDVFDANLFHGATFADLNQKHPKLLISASEMGDPKQFVFADESFQRIGSDLSTYRLSVAVTASAAVPGFYHTVVLQDHRKQHAPYLHLSDAAVMDNLGLLTLLEVLQRSLQQKTYAFPKGCVLISIDATPNFSDWDDERDDNRVFPDDYIIDRNASTAVDFILLHQRKETLRKLGMSHETIDVTAFSEFHILRDSPNSTTCHFWHIALRHIPKTGDLGKALTRIPTELNIRRQQQEVLFQAADQLVLQGWQKGASDWFLQRTKSKGNE